MHLLCMVHLMRFLCTWPIVVSLHPWEILDVRRCGRHHAGHLLTPRVRLIRSRLALFCGESFADRSARER